MNLSSARCGIVTMAAALLLVVAGCSLFDDHDPALHEDQGLQEAQREGEGASGRAIARSEFRP